MAARRSALRPLIISRSSYPGDTSHVLVATKGRPESIIDSAQATDLTLTPAELARLDQS